MKTISILFLTVILAAGCATPQKRTVFEFKPHVLYYGTVWTLKEGRQHQGVVRWIPQENCFEVATGHYTAKVDSDNVASILFVVDQSPRPVQKGQNKGKQATPQ